MRRLMTVSNTVQLGTRGLRHLAFRRAAGLLAVAGMFAASPAFSKDPDDSGIKSSSKKAPISTEGDESVAIPECLGELKLTGKQEDQIKDIMRSYGGSTSAVWKQFGERYMQTITTEAAMLAAIEDSFTETQRQQIRDHRRKTAQHEKATEATNDSLKQTTAKPSNVVKEELSGLGVTLTQEQEASADKIQQQYRSPMKSLNRDIHGLHSRLLALETEKLAAIEKVLTKDQLSQLRSNRQQGPKVATTN